MEISTGEKKNNLAKCLLRSLLFYVPVSFGHLGSIALSASSKLNIDSASFAGLLLKKLAILFAFSLIFGFSMLIFNIKKIPNAARWTLHVVVLYASMLGTLLLISDLKDNPSGKVIFIFIATMLFAIIYSISALVVYIRKRKRR